MTPDLWQRVERLYHLALAQPAEWRAEFLAHACGADEALRAEVESLLSASEGDEGFLEAPALAVAAQAQARYDACSNLAGSVVSGYRIFERLGAGRDAPAYRAVDTRLGLWVVVKFFTWTAGSAEARARFERGARVAAAVKHLNLCTIHDVGEWDGVPFVAMEFLEGETLEHRLTRKALDVEEAIGLGVQAADGLDAVHSAGLAHGGLNPASLFLTTRGQAKILGLGIMRASGESPDARADLGRLGALLNEITRGMRLPAKFEAALAKALETAPQARYQSAADLRADLQRAKRELENSATARRALAAHPSRLGRYRITGELGEGGMGIVYRGIDPVIDREVAIKTIPHDLLGSPEEASKLTERLKREARAAGSLTHPNIVTVFDAGEEQGFTYIVMELIPGSTLDAVLEAAGKRLPAHRALEILKQAAGALDFAHSHGVVHRDVKPSNIMVQQDGAVKLTDFGIAHRTAHMSVTLTGRIAGSPNFMSPEQLRGEDAGPRADQYSLAVVAWILLTGSVPFDDEEMLPLIEKIMGQEPPRCGDLSLAADAVLRRALAKDPAARFESCGSFVAALREACAPPAFPHGTPAIPHERPSKRGLMAASGLLAACLLAGAGVVWKLRTEPSATVGKEQKSAAIAPAQTAPPRPTEKAPAEKASAKSDPVAPAAPPASTQRISKTAAPASGTDKNLDAAAAAPLSGKPATTKINRVDGLTYVWIPPGSFSMGCSPGDGECMEDEKPSHPVTISTGFWMGQTEVTEEAYGKVTGKGAAIPGRSARPINGVKWEEAQGYCTTAGMRLPTEAEWEYAARAGSTGSRYGELDHVAWYDGNSGLDSHDVAGKEPNAWGLYDMLGNVWEWVADWYGRYQSGPVTNPQGPSEGPFRLRRGGGSRVGAKAARASDRVKMAPINPHYTAGFRCVGN